MNADSDYPRSPEPARDFIGYGRRPPHAVWPGQARLAVQFVLNYEEGAERSVVHGDEGSETFLSEMTAPQSFPNRHMSMESLYEYGGRAGVWRILDEFDRRGLPLTVFAVAQALEQHPELAHALVEKHHEIACHGWRWINYQTIDEETERKHMQLAMDTLTKLAGSAPLGWYTGRDSPNTRRLVVDHGGFLYDSDSYADDLPYWTAVKSSTGEEKTHLVIPYAMDTNDMKFSASPGFQTAEQFFHYLRDAFDVLYAEGSDYPKMLSIGMHCRILGRPGRFLALQRFLDHIENHDRVWITRRVDIAQHWHRHHAPLPKTNS